MGLGFGQGQGAGEGEGIGGSGSSFRFGGDVLLGFVGTTGTIVGEADEKIVCNPTLVIIFLVRINSSSILPWYKTLDLLLNRLLGR